jgi:hypothetical protein
MSAPSRLPGAELKSPAAQIATDVLGRVLGFLTTGERAIAKEVCTRWCQLVRARDRDVTLKAVDFASNVALLDWAIARGWCPSDDELARLALAVAKRVRPPVLQWLFDHCTTGIDNLNPNTIIASIGRVRTLEWLKRQHPVLFEHNFTHIERHLRRDQSLEVIKWHLRNRIVHLAPVITFNIMAASGSANKFAWVMRYISAQGSKPEKVFNMSGSSDFFTTLLTHQSPRRALFCMELAARKGWRPIGCKSAVMAARTEQYEALMLLHTLGPTNRARCANILAQQRLVAMEKFAPAGPRELEVIDTVMDWLATQPVHCDLGAHDMWCMFSA